VLIAARAIQGAAAAVTWTAGLAFVAAAYGPGRRGQLMGWIMTAMAAGSVLGAPAGGLLADALGYRAPFLATAALGGGEVVAVLLLFPDWRAARPETASAGRLAPAPRTTGPGGRFSRLLAGNGASRYPLAAVLAASIAVSAVEPLLPLHLKAAMGASPGVIGLLFGVAMGAYAVASPLAGALTDRIGPAGPITAGLAGLAVVTAALPHARSIPAVTVLLGGLGICLCAVLTAATTWLGTVADGMGERGYARAYALFNIVYASGMLLGPVQAGLITQAASLSVALAATGAICLVTVLPAVAVAGWRRALRRVPLSTEAAGPGETVPEAAPGASGAGGR
jgi:MFS family permease